MRAVTLSHGSPGVAEAALERGGVTALVERTLSSESIRAWKPAREVYLWAAGTCGVPPDRLALVAAHGWDVQGAQRAGLTGAWFPRSERVYPAVYDAAARDGPADLARGGGGAAGAARAVSASVEGTPLGPARVLADGAGRRGRRARWCSAAAPAAASTPPTWPR